MLCSRQRMGLKSIRRSLRIKQRKRLCIKKYFKTDEITVGALVLDMNVLKSAFQKYPRLANSVVYGSLYVGAEFSQQLISKKLTKKEGKEDAVDFKALGRYLIVGSVINSNYLYSWYQWLDGKYVGTHKSIIIKKVLLDQFIMTPPLYVIFYVSMSFLEGKKDLLEECKQKFVKTFADICLWLKENNIKRVIILSGISAHRRGDHQLKGEPLRYLFCPITRAEESEEAINRNWIELEIQNNVKDVKPSHVPGSGAAVKWYNKCVEEKIPCTLLLEFCSEGNNAPDALKLVDYLDEWLLLKDKHQLDNWVIPPSWNFLFGSQPPDEIFN